MFECHLGQTLFVISQSRKSLTSFWDNLRWIQKAKQSINLISLQKKNSSKEININIIEINVNKPRREHPVPICSLFRECKSLVRSGQLWKSWKYMLNHRNICFAKHNFPWLSKKENAGLTSFSLADKFFFLLNFRSFL